MPPSFLQKKIILLATIFIIKIPLIFAQKVQKKIPFYDPKKFENLKKEGYQLILNENFDTTTLNPKRWNKSDYNDYKCLRNRWFNPHNVLLDTLNGYCILQNTNTPCPYDTTCKAAVSEIKTFCNTDFEHLNWQNQQTPPLKFEAGNWVEMKVKMPQKAGSAGWLYNNYPFYCEIDLWEVYQNKPNTLAVSYHWQHGNAPTNHPNQGAERVRITADINLKTLDNKPFDITADWCVIAIQFTNQSIIWYVNGTPVFELYLNKPAPRKFWVKPKRNRKYVQKIRPTTPMSMLVSTGYYLNEKTPATPFENLPQNLIIDYIRVYKKL